MGDNWTYHSSSPFKTFYIFILSGNLTVSKHKLNMCEWLNNIIEYNE